MKETISIRNKRNTVGVCYVIIPGNVDRGLYIKNCYRRGIISVQFEDGGHLDNVPVCIDILQWIEFPSDIEKLGSGLLYVNERTHNKPIIVGRLLKNDEAISLSENEFKFEKTTDNGNVIISGKGDSGNLFISVYGKGNYGGKMYVNIKNDSDKAEFNLSLNGQINIDTQKINIGKVKSMQAVLKGDDTITQLKKEVQALTDLLNDIKSLVVQPVPPNAVDPTWASLQSVIANITDRADYSNVESTKLFSE
jgi:hypothetical protein